MCLVKNVLSWQSSLSSNQRRPCPSAHSAVPLTPLRAKVPRPPRAGGLYGCAHKQVPPDGYSFLASQTPSHLSRRVMGFRFPSTPPDFRKPSPIAFHTAGAP